ncbi:MAG TPA: GHMP kinase [Candidatus Hydrogenedens sp.]|nr:GHMP kinase [Candidatus Hydrogenedens sp.]HOK09507.1 GHMP kinase [Candidatus Hydrogenedens sp.]HOL20218.1 GHMP kinase [Candidatus Hydrogenedens sp.]HPP59216.1 GHMP kinase [Candidatus Hydrogenedens sp.]
MAYEAVAYARAGLVGNPSDGYYGKTISVIIRNFFAKVSLYESPQLEIIPSYQDQSKYESIEHLTEDVRINGYYGGIRLMKAGIYKFYQYCKANKITLPQKNFSIRYRSTIPRRLGLAGSSALVTATMRCLMEFYEVDIPKPILPNLILSVETEELGIFAGLQDRVIQVYEGCVFMNFDRTLMETRGYGHYEEIPVSLLPKLFIAYRKDLSEGSEVFHNNVRERWLSGDPEVHQAMRDFAEYAQKARDLLLAGKGEEIGIWMDKNFDRRRSIYNLDPRQVRLVDVARSVGAHAQFTGSGGAIVGIYKDEAMYEKIVEALQTENAVVIKPQIEPAE